jgi:hypothetical protein
MIEKLIPGSDNKLFRMLAMMAVMTESSVGGIVGISDEILFYEKSMRLDVINRDVEEVEKEILDEKMEYQGILVVKMEWGLPATVSDEEVKDWMDKIDRHPDAFRMLVCAGRTKTERREWLVRFDILSGPPFIKIFRVEEVKRENIGHGMFKVIK